jgi:hypothetical protein
MMAKSGDTGRSYEILVKEIFQTIHDQDQVANVEVEHNKTLQGIVETHQIDVYWKFEKGGITHEAVVQAKDWQSRVTKGELLHFKAVLDDLPNQPRGIFVTRSGYQQGAKNYANAHGIILYALDEPRPRPNTTITTLGWVKYEAEVRSFKLPAKTPEQEPVEELAIGLKTTVCEPHYSNIEFQIDPAWFDQNLATTQQDKSRIRLHPLPILQVILYNQDKNPVSNLETIVRQEVAAMKDEQLDRKHVVHVFDSNTFLGPPCTMKVFIKVNKVSLDLEIQVTHTPARFNLSKFVQLVLREIPTEKTRIFLTSKT